MSLRGKVVAYLAAIHVVLAAVAVLALRDRPLWLLAAEVLFVLSLVLGFLLVRAFFVPLQLIRTGTELVAEEDFTSTFRPVGQPEMDALVAVYNRMIGELRSERLRLQEQHHFLDEVLKASPAGVLTLDFDGRLSEANPAAAKLLGAEPEALAGRRLAELPSPLGGELEALEPGASRVLPLGGRRLKATRGELYDRGFPRSFFLVEELTEELRASEKAAYETLIRTLSHEVNNSLAPVLSILESAREEMAPKGDLDRALAAAATRLDHLGVFMRGYAEVVRLPPPEKRPCDLAVLLDEILVLLGPELTRRRIACTWEERQEAPPVDLDRNQLEQVLVNVLRNAMEAIGEEGTIVLSLTPERAGGSATRGVERPVLTIRDTGPGIPGEARHRLFTPFFSTKKNGRGLGLTLAHEILTQHDFEFNLENHPEGGAQFTILF